MKTEKLNGLIAATYTPLSDTGEIRLDQVAPMVDFLLKGGVTGLYVCGSTGEGMSLTSEERRAVASCSRGATSAFSGGIASARSSSAPHLAWELFLGAVGALMGEEAGLRRLDVLRELRPCRRPTTGFGVAVDVLSVPPRSESVASSRRRAPE